MDRIEVDIATGERTVIPLTPEEEADALARTAAEEPGPVPVDPVQVLTDKLIAKGVLDAEDVVEMSRATK